jgi:hypothetical protein
MELVSIFRAEEQLLNFELPSKMTSMISDIKAIYQLAER